MTDEMSYDERRDLEFGRGRSNRPITVKMTVGQVEALFFALEDHTADILRGLVEEEAESFLTDQSELEVGLTAPSVDSPEADRLYSVRSDFFPALANLEVALQRDAGVERIELDTRPGPPRLLGSVPTCWCIGGEDTHGEVTVWDVECPEDQPIAPPGARVIEFRFMQHPPYGTEPTSYFFPRAEALGLLKATAASSQ
jgi:hypothetical protein